MVSGGAPLSPEIARFLHALSILILEGWGATEATAPATINTPADYRFGTVGKTIMGVAIRRAEDGELEIKGPNILKGYWKNPEATQEAFTPDGFYRTGDIGVIEPEGWIKITDRKKQLIITAGGKNIPPAPIEELLLRSPCIDQAYIHGDRRRYLTALLVLDPGPVTRAARKRGLPGMTWEDIIQHPQVIKQLQQEVDHANAQLPR